ncbi:hypothetical protein RI367_003481 [Sorochytrium milnesiophthora]
MQDDETASIPSLSELLDVCPSGRRHLHHHSCTPAVAVCHLKSGGAPDACSVAITASGGGTVVMAAVPAASSAAAADAHHSALLPPAASSDQQQHLVYCRHLALSALEFIASAFPATPFDHLAQSNPLLVLAATLKIHMSPSAGGVAGYAHVLDAFTTVDGMLFVRFPPPRAALHWTDHAAFQDGVTGLIELAEEVLQCRQLVCCLPRGGGGDTKPPAGADQLLRAFMYVGFTPIDAATVVHDAARYQLLGYEL